MSLPADSQLHKSHSSTVSTPSSLFYSSPFRVLRAAQHLFGRAEKKLPVIPWGFSLSQLTFSHLFYAINVHLPAADRPFPSPRSLSRDRNFHSAQVRLFQNILPLHTLTFLSQLQVPNPGSSRGTPIP